MTTATIGTACLVCAGISTDSLLDGVLLRCQGCGFAWTASNGAVHDDLYGESYFRGEGYEDYFQPAARRFEAGRRLHWLLRAAPVQSLVKAGCAAWRSLKPGGVLALEVPNIASGAAARFGIRWAGLQPEFHRWHFSPGSLVRLVEAHGFVVAQRDTAVFRYYMPAWYRRRHVRELLPADLISLRSGRLTHPSRGDLLRLIARRPELGGRHDRIN